MPGRLSPPPLTLAGEAPARTKIEENEQKPSTGTTDPVRAPADLFTGDMASSGCGGERGQDEDPPAAFCSGGGYHTFSEASLDPTFSQDTAGLHINNDRRQDVSCSLGFASSQEEGAIARGRSGATAVGRDNEHGGQGSVPAEPETFPLSGGGYSPFSSASLVSSGSSNSMPRPPDAPLTTEGLGGDRSGQGTLVSPAAAGGVGSGGDGGRGGSGQKRRVPQSTFGEPESRLTGVKAPLEKGGEKTNGSPTPLSPDALTPFSRGDPEAKERDR